MSSLRSENLLRNGNSLVRDFIFIDLHTARRTGERCQAGFDSSLGAVTD